MWMDKGVEEGLRKDGWIVKKDDMSKERAEMMAERREWKK